MEEAAKTILTGSQTFPQDLQTVAEALPLRQDMLSLLTYLRDNKVTGTHYTGNLPKAVHVFAGGS